MLPAPSAPGHSSLGTQANQAPGMWHQLRSIWPEGNRISIPFSIYFCFYPIIWTGVNYNLVRVFFFFFLSFWMYCILIFLMTRSFFSKSVSLWERTFVSIFRLHLEVISHDTCPFLSLLLQSEWSSLLYFLELDLALFPTSLSLRNVALCICAPSSVSIHL